MSKFVSILAASALSASLIAPAQAGNLANGGWAGERCGEKPAVAVLDLRNPDAFNKSVAGVNEYREKIKKYLDCLVAEANLDIQVITKTVTAEQLAARQADEKIAADAKAANEKFDGK